MPMIRSKPAAERRQPGRIKAAILEWLGVPIGLTDTAFWTQLVANSDSGQAVSEDSMLALSTVKACTRLLSDVIATLPFTIYERTQSGRRIATNHPLYSIIHTQPNADTTAFLFWQAVVSAMLLRGNGHIERLEIAGRLVGLNFLAPKRLSRKRGPSGGYVYTYIERDSRRREIPGERVVTMPGFTLDGEEGISVIQYGANVFGKAQAAETAAGKAFENGLLPTTYFKMAGTLKKEQRAEFRENLQSISGAINAGKSPLLEGGMDVGTVGINPKDAQLLETRQFSVEEICRWFGIPPWMVGHQGTGTKWGTGMEQELIAFLTFTLLPLLRTIEQIVNIRLLSPADRLRYYAEFNVEGFLRADSAARASFYSVMVNNGIFTRDEIRVKENMSPRGGNADVLTVQSAMVPIDAIGNAGNADQARAALVNWLKELQPESVS